MKMHPSDVHAYIAAIERAQPDELSRFLLDAKLEEERLLRTYFGDDRYRRLFSLALEHGAKRSKRALRGNVVVIHGIMGSELTAMQGHEPVKQKVSLRQIWMRITRLALGDLRLLKLNEDGTSEFDPAYQVQATGILKNHYGEQLLHLAKNWNVRAFWFDWRKDLNEAAKHLHLKLTEWFDDEPVHIVAHSMGGLVARTFVANYPDHWKSLRDPNKNQGGGRLIMLGTPNHGSFAIPQIMTGVESTLRKLALLDLHHSVEEILRIVNTFVGSYQMLPSPFLNEEYAKLFESETYGPLSIPQSHLSRARDHHEHLRKAVDIERMIYIAGYDQPTYSGIRDYEQFLNPEPKRARRAYEETLDGDGRVPHALGLLKDEQGNPVPTYFVDEIHGELPQNRQVLAALDELLVHGQTQRLAKDRPRRRFRSAKQEREEAARRMEAVEREHEMDEARVRAYVSLSQRRTRSDDDSIPGIVTPEERIAEEMVTRGFLSVRTTFATGVVDLSVPFEPPRLSVRVVCADLGAETFLTETNPPVDAISVGHYKGVKPVYAERALDEAISQPLGAGAGLDEQHLLITRLSERGTIRGDLGQPFFLPDYRTTSADKPRRIIAVAGMGEPGRFGIPELTVLVRELAWALGCMGKRHLASVLIGAGNGNLSVEEAVSAWIRGLKLALTGAGDKGIERLTLVEHSPSRVLAIDAALRRVQQDLRPGRMKLDYNPLTPAAKADLMKQEKATQVDVLEKELRHLQSGESIPQPSVDTGTELEPTRLTVMLEGDRYRFGAITHNASVPEREVAIDPALINEANDRLATEWDPQLQRDHGRVLERLLIPQDLRPHLASSAPLVVLLDRSTARIHWEMVAQPDVLAALGNSKDSNNQPLGDSTTDDLDKSFYLGTSRSFTRQLRTTFAPPPEPPPPPRRVLRVLVVVDPAEDAPLVGAREEGEEVATLFDQFNALYADGKNRVEVVRLFGPFEASRLNVLSELTRRTYDVLHFAGHCFYNAEEPEASGWIFSKGQVLSARELKRIDRVPQFVFSNACESGVTALDGVNRTAELAPSFAEAFFLRGVSNFVCTAWPIDDLAARTFARILYANLLGIRLKESANGLEHVREPEFVPRSMHLAMRAARLTLLDTATGVQTWGAYQHYGNPYYRFFAPDSGGNAYSRSRTKTRKGSTSQSSRAKKANSRPHTKSKRK